MQLTPEQQHVADRILAWLDIKQQVLTFGGYAGCGKTTVLTHLIGTMRAAGTHDPATLAPTGKAASNIRRKGVACATIHSHLYTHDGEDSDGNPVWSPRAASDIPGDFFIVDEASMVAREQHEDLLRLGRKILYVGDHGQLEPVGESPDLMANPDLRLETVMRQALDSPILRFAHHVREGRGLVYSSEPSLTICRTSEAALRPERQYIVGTNATRISLNKEIRDALGFSSVLQPGDRIICLRNNRGVGVYNGEIFSVVRCSAPKHGTIAATITDGERELDVELAVAQFGSKEPAPHNRQWLCYFDYGYAITCHKAQGAEFDHVTVIEDFGSWVKWSVDRWRYTASTRAKESLIYAL